MSLTPIVCQEMIILCLLFFSPGYINQLGWCAWYFCFINKSDRVGAVMLLYMFVCIVVWLSNNIQHHFSLLIKHKRFPNRSSNPAANLTVWTSTHHWKYIEVCLMIIKVAINDDNSFHSVLNLKKWQLFLTVC